MEADLYHIIETEVARLSDVVADELKASANPHYRELDFDTLHQRSAALVAAFVEASMGQPERFAVYVRTIALHRSAQGYLLREIQQALSILLEHVWALVIRHSNHASLVLNLTAVSRTISRAKDELAQVYLESKEEVEARLARLGETTDELFKGTDANLSQ